MRYYFTKEMAEETADIYRMNKLLEIEHSNWERQLKQAVSSFLYFVVLSFERPSHSLNFSVHHLCSLFLVQGFKDSSISIFEASCILHKYEEQTGLTVTREELDSGALKTKLAPSDYDTTCLVSFLTHSHLYRPTKR